MLSIMEMGVVRNAEIINNVVEITITPTYSGCPAMDMIGEDIRKAMTAAGYKSKIILVNSPAWSSGLDNSKREKSFGGLRYCSTLRPNC